MFSLISKHWRARLLAGVSGCLLTVPTLHSALAAGAIDIADTPPFLGGVVSPNIMFIIDDSGSMQFELPESSYDQDLEYLFPPVSNMYGGGIYSTRIFDFDENNPYNRYFRSHANNVFFYNPLKEYEPWYHHDQTQWADADPANAPRFPGRAASGTVNLLGENWHDQWQGSSGGYNNWKTYRPITYYVMKEGADPAEKASYIQYQITGNTASRKDLADYSATSISEFDHGNGVVRTVEEEAQNFANWFSYHRSRTLAARSGIGNAFSKQPEILRVGYGRLNKGSSDVDGTNTDVISRGVRLFKGADREAFFDSLYTDGVPNAGTPLRNALFKAGQYFQRTDNSGPWGAQPGQNDSTEHLECRQSYTILMTDGYWSGSLNNAVGNVDGSTGPLIDGYGANEDYQYTPGAPFEDGFSNTLADVAMYYWNRDLRTDLDNRVPTTPGNPAFWQHMVTFGVGLGVFGSIDAETADTIFDSIVKPPAVVPGWPSPFTSEAAKVDDLLHAGVNSRGGFFSAADPETFATELNGVLTKIINLVERSSTTAAASSFSIQADTLAYSGAFRSQDWSGILQATTIGSGELIWDAEWNLENTDPDDRNLYSFNGDGTTLEFDNLSQDQKDALNKASDGTSDSLGYQRVDWLRGTEQTGESFRDRSYTGDPGTGDDRLRLLGDIIGSDPQYVGKADFGYRMLPGQEGRDYLTFRRSTEYTSRPDVIYVGANDGFLHAFHTLTGEELFGYMPSELLAPRPTNGSAAITELMDPDYQHRYFMDGTPTISDAYIDGQWRTILVGAMGAGGRTVFALDVTNPETFDETDILWEFTDPDLGYGVESPRIVRLDSGKWAAVFGNGYNSDTNQSGLFIVDLADGSLISKVMTKEGNASTPNGMAPALVLGGKDNYLIAETAYAGDLLGNLWRFDLDGFKVSRLFQATDSAGSAQPITAGPNAARLPDGEPSEIVVVFGTGSYFRTGDNSDNQVQSLYGIFDDGSNKVLSRSDLLEQTIESQQNIDFDGSGGAEPVEVRVISDNLLADTDRGWYLDLDKEIGERIVSRPSFPSGYDVQRVRFSTLIPETDICGGGADGYLMDLDLDTGGRTADPVFDFNRDGKFTSADNVGGSDGTGTGTGTTGTVASGVRGVVAGEEIRIVTDRKQDKFVRPGIIELPPGFPPGGISIPSDGDDGDEGGTGGGGTITIPPQLDPESPPTGAAGGADYGRQSWEELL